MARFKTILIIAAAVVVAVLIFAWNRPLMSSLSPLASVSSSSHSVTLTWKAVPGAKSYKVYRATDGAHYQLIASPSITTYKDAPVPSKAVFYYAVTAVNDNGESKYSNEIKVVVP
jgi:fibronectin type 3 domain-containing protein